MICCTTTTTTTTTYDVFCPFQESDVRRRHLKEANESQVLDVVDVDVEEGCFSLIEPETIYEATKQVVSPGTAEPAKW